MVNCRAISSILLFVLLLLFLYLLDEFHDEKPIIITGFVTLFVVTAIIGFTVFRVSVHHVCPLCNRNLGSRGDVVSRQLVHEIQSFVCWERQVDENRKRFLRDGG